MISLEEVWARLERHEHIDCNMRDILESLPDEFDPEVI